MLSASHPDAADEESPLPISCWVNRERFQKGGAFHIHTGGKHSDGRFKLGMFFVSGQRMFFGHACSLVIEQSLGLIALPP